MRPQKLFTKFLGYFLLAVCVSAAAEQAPTVHKPVLAIQHWQTSQGAPVYFVRNPELPMVDIQIIFTAGSAYDNQQWGLASLTVSMLNEGTQKHSADQIAETFDQAGAQFSGQTNRDVAVIALRSLSDTQYFTPALDMFTEVLSQANFPDNALSRVKQQTIAAIREQQENPMAIAMDTFYQKLYGEHPYAHNVLGTPAIVNAITRQQLQAFYQRFLVSHNAQIILVGNLNRAAAQKIAQQLMGALPVGDSAPALAVANTAAAHGLQPVTFASQQTSIVIGQLGIDRQNSQYFPLTVGNFLLGQMPLNSLLFEQVRNQHGLAYNVSSALSPLTYRGPFIIGLQTRAAQTQQALNVTEQTVRQFVTAGPQPQPLGLAKQNLINHFPLNFATNEDIADVLTQMAVNHRPLDYLDTYRANIQAVTAEQVQHAFQTLIQPGQLLTITVGQS